MNGKSILIAGVLVIFAAMVSGILAVGSPFQARKDRFDDLRLSDLVTIASSLTCDRNFKKVLPDLPSALNLRAFTPYCKSFRIRPKSLADSETGEPYKYVRIDARTFKICAEFHDAVKTKMNSLESYSASIAFDAKSGCVNGKLR